jgi:hypothetical protein
MAAEAKAKQIQTAKDDIETEKKLIEYLKLVEIKSHATYKKYASIKGNLDTFLTKSKDLHEELKVPLEKLQQSIKHLEEIIAKAGENDKVTVPQGGKPVEFDVSIVKETLKEWKQLLSEIVATKDEITKHSIIKSNSAKEIITHGETNISCGELDKMIARYLKEIPKAIEENKGLKFHQSNLFNLENKLLKLEGKPPLKKAVSTKGPIPKTISQPALNLDKGAQAAGIAAAAAMKLQAKSKAKPSLDKLVSSL